MKDLIIIGAGPAGLSAAVYAFRAGLDIEIIEGNYVAGGQVLLTYEVDNYLGMPGVSGFDMGVTFKDHVEKMGIEIQNCTVESIEKNGNIFKVCCKEKCIEAKSVIITTGAQNRKLDVKGEEKYSGKGVSYCAACDGSFFKGKNVAVVGGSYTAVEDAIYLAAICKEVYLVHRRDKLRAGAFLEKKLFACENVKFIENSVVNEIIGGDDDKVSALAIENVKTSEKDTLPVSGVFIAVGTTPKTELVEGLVELDANGYVIAGEKCETSLKGLFAAGDLRTKPLRQIITAVADGANAATSVWAYLLEQGN